MSDSFTNEAPAQEYGSLKTLTILTFIGSALAFFGGIWQFINADKSVSDLEKAMSKPDLPDFAKKLMTPEALENAKLVAANKLPILILGLVGAGLCLLGAIQMRKLKQQGYYLWLMGELLPVIGTLIFIGAGAFTGWGAILGYALLFIFVLLYTLQRKYLINK